MLFSIKCPLEYAKSKSGHQIQHTKYSFLALRIALRIVSQEMNIRLKVNHEISDYGRKCIYMYKQ